jgi:hypothetical protein
VHDRPWPEPPVFGKVPSMNAQGLERKFDMRPICAPSMAWSAPNAGDPVEGGAWC